ncbi:EAL domain-containing protein [Massilia niastensis]|uniref:EAL domain-containing protein n=1 Tax=Massilia niastensis TaxID=544911 RepID=UPI0003A53A0B|nr:EAL domain-containing protein [Massilia niastensis]
MPGQVDNSTVGTCASGWQRLATTAPGPLPIEPFLQIALGFCEALAPLYRTESCYGLLTPESVFVCRDNWQVQLAGLAHSGNLPAQGTQVVPTGPVLPYLAPEQSGRINQRVDARSDCYSLGVIFYQLLTGSLPFEAGDALGWVHAHLARKPQAPHVKHPGVPAPLSAIVMKMLEKSPDKRYQSIGALQADLSQCLQHWRSTGTIAPFAIGRHDVAGGLRTLQRLYGRERDLAAMSAAYRSVAERGASSLLLLSGPAGVGKSAVVGELEKAIYADGGSFIAGKFDQYKGQTPYATLCEALSQLVQALLGGEEAALRTCRDRLDTALAGNGALLLDLIPHVRLLLGEQPPPPALPPKEAQRRFFATLRSFIAVFSERARPLVIFLDDLQWTDRDTLSFLHYLLVDTATPGLLVIGAYRDNEIPPSHPLTEALARLRAGRLAMTDLHLAPLSSEDFATMIADVLDIDRQRARPLALLVHRKTAGIPLFALHFLARLENEGHLRHEQASGSWQWDLDAINAQAYSDNVIDLMLAAFRQQLPEATLDLLRYAACIGHVVDLALLARVAGDITEQAVRTTLRDALAAGFIDQVDRSCLRFAHDRIRQAVYATIPRARREAIHLAIARRLLAGEERGAFKGSVFEIADQFNLGSAGIDDDRERLQCMEVNLRAGTRAKASGAHSSASHYLAMGLGHFRPGDFDTVYRTAYCLHVEQAGCCYLLDRTDEAAALIELLLQQTHGKVDRARVLHLKIELLMAKERYAEAFAALDECTRLFGIELPADVTAEEAMAEEAKFWDALGERPIEALASTPVRPDEAYEFLLDSLMIAMPLAAVRSEHLFHVMVAHAVNLAPRHGNTGQCAMAYALLAYVCCYRDEFGVAARLERLARQIVHGPVPERYRAPVLMVTGVVGSFTRPLRLALADLQSSFESGRISDEPVAANLACEYLVELRCALGDPLADVLQDVQARIDFVKGTAYTPTRPVLEALRAFIRNQRGETRQLLSFDADDFDERALEDQLEHTPGSPLRFVYYSLKLQARYRFGDFANASLAASKAGPFSLLGYSIHTAEFHFYRTLTAAALCSSVDAGSAEWRQHREVLDAGCARLAGWKQHCPDNFSARSCLADAERARVDGDEPAAVRLYMQAIEAAHAQEAPQLTALAHELAAACCRAHGLDRLADTLLATAMLEYRRWGAEAKVEQLRQRYLPGHAEPSHPSPATSASRAGELDLLTVVKAAQSIANEVTTGRLHETLLRTLVEHVGAQCAHLLVFRQGHMVLVESARFQDEHFLFEKNASALAGPERVPETLINYVARARTPLVLDDASRTGVFVHDPYFRQRQPCAVLCMPIRRQNALIGVLYLENSQLAGAFARVNLEVLEWLLAQVAISMENAGLYENLQDSESLLTAVMENVPACVYMKDPQGRYLYINREFEKTIGISLADTLGKTDYELLQEQPGMAELVRKADLVALRGETIRVEEDFPTADGAPHTFLSVKTPLYANNEVKGLCGISMDISEQKRARERIDYLAHYDLLTGLPNRHLLADRIEQALAEARRTGTQVGLLVLDLDRFKVINDSLGHRVGDLLLQEVAARLKACVRECDTVARLDGDAFVLIAPGLGGGEAARPIASKISDSLALPYRLGSHRATTSVCIGISLFPDDASEGDTLLQYAEMAMYYAKVQGNKTMRFYDEAMDLRAQERLAMENELRSAIANDELYLLYQPQVDLPSHQVTGGEALVRWRHPVRGVISPARFIPLAEECGLISEITEWAIHQACTQLRKWKDQGLPNVSLAVNVSARNVQQDDLYRWVASALAAQDIDGGFLELEMTEGTLMTDMEASIEKLVALKRLGIHTSIDDFGTGYSSLSYLKRLPVDKLKIDQSFVRDIAHDPNDAAITSAIIAMGKQLKLKVIAEGVEDREAERFLLKHHCDQMQGYLFSPPISAEAFAEMLALS